MKPGMLLTLWTARVSFLFYVGAVAAWLMRRPNVAKVAWTAGWLAYIGHVFSAFQFQYHWSHDAAYQETARRTAELMGVNSGAGLYWNYVFTLVWTIDVIWMWASAGSFGKRPRWITVSVQAFMAFMFFNATIIFAGR